MVLKGKGLWCQIKFQVDLAYWWSVGDKGIHHVGFRV